MPERLGVHATKPQQMCKVIWLREALCVLRPERRIRRDFWELEPSRLCLSIAWTLPASLRKDLCVYVCDCACMSACFCMCVHASTAKEGANYYGSISKSIARLSPSLLPSSLGNASSLLMDFEIRSPLVAVLVSHCLFIVFGYSLSSDIEIHSLLVAKLFVELV